MKLALPGRTVAFPRRPLIMGIVNVNDDSFSGDGTLDPDEALAKAAALIADGADLIDVGAESARTNREAIPGRGRDRPPAPLPRSLSRRRREGAPPR